MKLNWVHKSFEKLTNQELYDTMVLRQKVFIVEQDCPYMDADGKDLLSSHLMGRSSDRKLLAYSRIVPPGVSYAEPSIGRIATSIKCRRMGVGKLLMKESIQKVEDEFGLTDIRISAQCYLIPFYRQFDFETIGSSYLEDDIPHIEMLRR